MAVTAHTRDEEAKSSLTFLNERISVVSIGLLLTEQDINNYILGSAPL